MLACRYAAASGSTGPRSTSGRCDCSISRCVSSRTWERDASDYWNKSYRLATRAADQCPASAMLCEWALLYSPYDSKRLSGFQKLLVRCPDSIGMIIDLTDLCYYLDMRPQAKQYSAEWLKLDPTSPGAQIAVNGTASCSPQAAWQMKAATASAYQMTSAIRDLRPLLESLEKQYSNSAYVRYSAGTHVLRRRRRGKRCLGFRSGLPSQPERRIASG